MSPLGRISIYANPPFNHVGTTLFLAYIALALYFTLTTIDSLHKQYKRISTLKIPQDAQSARKRHIKIYTGLATISFTILSYNMLRFLIESLATWSRTKSLLGVHPGGLALGDWMLESTLFTDFAKELVKDCSTTVWTQAALLGTWYSNVWMAYKAQQHSFTPTMMVRYIILSQILPVSFSMCLFIIQLHLDTIGLSPDTSSNYMKKKQQKESQKKPPHIKQSSLALPTVILNVFLLALPSLKNHAVFIPLVFLVRLMLFVPHTGRVALSEQNVMQSISIAGGCVVANLAMLRSVLNFWDVVNGLSRGGFAVKALGRDFQLGMLVYAVLGWGGGV